MKDHTETLNNVEFTSWLSKPEQVEKYQGITREKFDEFYTQAKKHARVIASAIGIPVDSIDTDTSDKRLSEMMKNKEVFEINGLYWQHEALDDATQAFYDLE